MKPNKENRIARLAKQLYNRFDGLSVSIPENRSKYRICWLLTIVLFFGLILAMNILTPMIADDFCYLLIFGDFQTTVSTISDIFISQVNHYEIWGGRSVVHFIAQALLLLPPVIIDILNTIVYILYTGLIYYLIKGKKSHSLMLFILINLAVWFMQPAFGDTILWVTGSANYLWGTTLVLLFILPYRLYDGNKEKPLTFVLKASGLFLLGIIAGWTNENTAAGTIVMAFLFLFYYRSNKWQIPQWAVSALVGAIIGYLIMILAPGNQVRAGEAMSFEPMVIAYRLVMHTISLFNYCGALNILYILFGILAWRFTKNAKSQMLKLSFLFLAGALVAVYSMILSPSFPPRAWFGVLTFYIIALGIFVYNIDYTIVYFRQIRYLIVIVTGIALLFSTYPAFKDIYAYYTVSHQRDAIVKEAKSSGRTYVEFERHVSHTKFIHFEDPKAYEFMYGYYGIEIRFKDKE